MNKAELIAAVAENAELTKKDAEKAVKAFIEVVTDELKKGEKVQVVGFGTFEVAERAAREGRNPHTGQPVSYTHLQESKLQNLSEIESIYEQILEKQQCFTLKQLAVTGRDLIAEGIPAGPRLGEICLLYTSRCV